jgi:hypothetical protein
LPVSSCSVSTPPAAKALRENYCEEEDHNGFAEDKVQEVILENRRRSCEVRHQSGLASTRSPTVKERFE